MKPPIELKIEELRLAGFPAADAERVVAALRGELMRRLAEQGLPARGAEIDQLDLGTLRLRPGASPEALGRATGAALHASLAGPRRGRGKEA